MQKYLCVEGVQGRPYGIPDVPGRYVAMSRKWNAETAEHEEECFRAVVPFDQALVKAVNKGDLKQWHKPVMAKDLATARKMAGLDKPMAEAVAEAPLTKDLKRKGGE